MRKVLYMTALPLIGLLTACGVPDDGYYDSNGNYVAAPNAVGDSKRRHSPDPGMADRRPERYRYNRYHDEVVYDEPAYTYNRRGYYDYNGYYVTFEGRRGVPANMFPPRGMCRVWIPERSVENQPPVESCDGINRRVPVGAYVVYGG